MKASLVVAAAAVALLCIVTAASASESRATSPDARFMEATTEVDAESSSSMLRPVSVVDSSQYAALKHEQAQKALRDLHLPGERADIYAQLGIERDADSETEEGADEDAAADESDAELLTLAAETEEGADESEDEADSSDAEDLEAEISAAEEDASFLQIDEEDADAADEEAEDEADDDADDEADDEAEDEDSDEADEEDSDEFEDEADEEDADEADDEADDEEALIEESAAPAAQYISPVLRPPLPQKHKDVMPDSNYDKVAETNLLPNPFRRALKARKVKAGKPNPAAKGRRRGARRSRKARAAARKGRGKGKGKGKGKGAKKGRKGAKKARKSRAAARRGAGGKWPFDGKDPRALITPPSLQSIWDARHKQFISSTNDLIKELDDGLIEHGIHPPLADPNKKKCKKKRNSRK